METKELADRLTGSEYPLRITKEVKAAAKASGLVIVYGASDDLMEFDGAIYDEIGAYGGTEVWVDATGLVPDFDSIDKSARDGKDRLRDYFKREEQLPPPPRLGQRAARCGGGGLQGQAAG